MCCKMHSLLSVLINSNNHIIIIHTRALTVVRVRERAGAVMFEQTGEEAFAWAARDDVRCPHLLARIAAAIALKLASAY